MSDVSPLKPPEWLVFLRALLLGLVLAEIGRVAFLASSRLGQQLADAELIGPLIVGSGIAVAVLIAYSHMRGAYSQVRRVFASRRFELGGLLLAGAWIDQLVAPQLTQMHEQVAKLSPGWPLAISFALLAILSSTVLRPALRGSRQDSPSLYFVSDAEITSPEDDLLETSKQAIEFADVVLTCGTKSEMVFGLDGPWGVGKTSFLNMATKRWSSVAADQTIVFKFEPMRYASEPDLSERFIKDLCAKIQQSVFAPEFMPAVNRYSRMLKGKTDLSILGVKFSLEPSNETIDELLGDIDALLEQIERRLIIIIDDLDRLEPKLVNNVLFTVRRTFKLKHATYILCYDTEMLVAGKEEGGRARDFLEKFITAKLSLFIDMQSIKAFLVRDWHADSTQFPTIPAERMQELQHITKEAGELVSGPQAHLYVPLLGDLRKVKRFINAMLLMKLEKTNPGPSDFHARDLIHLVLLQLCFPGLFRRLYVEETEGRVGSFSIRRATGGEAVGFSNADEFANILEEAPPAAAFLLKALFHVGTLKVPSTIAIDDRGWRKRACFNLGTRTLEKYLQLIVRFKVPEATTTFTMYERLLDDILEGKTSIAMILEMPQFDAHGSEGVHERFWEIVKDNAHRLSRRAADEAITTLIRSLPLYSSLDPGDRSTRQRSIYMLLLLLERAGFGELPGRGRARPLKDVVEIAYWVLGGPANSRSPTIIQRLVEPSRGALGWDDLMIFRLHSCLDRGGQVHNICTALLRYENSNAVEHGDVALLTRNSMRRFSQLVFQEFKRRYISQNLNFFIEVDAVSDDHLLGKYDLPPAVDADIQIDLKARRSIIKSFVIYQLTNRQDAVGDGIGCGFYDEEGAADQGGIHSLMCDYLFGFCFNPRYGVAHARAFADYCLRALRDRMMDRLQELETFDIAATQAALTGLVGSQRLTLFWMSSGNEIKQMLKDLNGTVFSYRYKATYVERLPLVFAALDQLTDSGAQALPQG